MVVYMLQYFSNVSWYPTLCMTAQWPSNSHSQIHSSVQVRFSAWHWKRRLSCNICVIIRVPLELGWLCSSGHGGDQACWFWGSNSNPSPGVTNSFHRCPLPTFNLAIRYSPNSHNRYQFHFLCIANFGPMRFSGQSFGSWRHHHSAHTVPCVMRYICVCVQDVPARLQWRHAVDDADTLFAVHERDRPVMRFVDKSVTWRWIQFSVSLHSVFTQFSIRFSCSFHSVFKQFSISFHSVFIRFSISFHAVCIQLPISFHADSIKFSCSFHSVFMQIQFSVFFNFHSVFIHKFTQFILFIR